MKIALAVLVAILFHVVGWLLVVALLLGIELVASHARGGMELIQLVNLLLIWFLAPGVGGFVAIYSTAKCFKTISVSTIATSFISVVVTFSVVMGALSLPSVQHGTVSIFMLGTAALQVVATVVGATIGKKAHIDGYAYSRTSTSSQDVDVSEHALDGRRS